jgi:hypothetical protein
VDYRFKGELQLNYSRDKLAFAWKCETSANAAGWMMAELISTHVNTTESFVDIINMAALAFQNSE